MKATSSPDTHTAVMPAATIESILKRSQRVLVASHIDPDGDAIGTQLAFGAYLHSLGKQVYMVRDAETPDKYTFLSHVDEIHQTAKLPADFAVDTAVILECPTIQRIGSASKFLNGGVSVINIDHHRDNSQFGEVNWVDIQPSSVGEMAYEYFRAVGYDISIEVAECLYTAIVTDTGRFRFPSTSPRTMQIAGDLIAAGADPRKIADMVYFNLRPSTMILTGKVLNSIEFYCEGRVCVLYLTQDMLREAGAVEFESDGLVDFTLFARGVKAGALIKELKNGQTKVSFRSQNGVNVSAIAYKFGGGGHFNAAGCTIPMPFKEARTEVIRLLCEADNALA